MIYLDSNATTRAEPQVIQYMMHWMEKHAGNASSVHAMGRDVRNELNKARREIAATFGVNPLELLFTSGGTESANMVLRGLPKGHIITSSVEHSCVYATSQTLGRDITYLEPGPWGAVTVDQVKNALRPDTVLIALMAVNNETGVKTDIESIAAFAKEISVPFFVDGVALVGKENFILPEGVSAFSFSAHKFHGPQGVGGLILRAPLKLTALLTGGPQEYNKRAGTENIAGIIGMQHAFQLLSAHQMEFLRDRLEREICERLQDVVVNGEGPRICNVSNLSFLGVDGESLLMNLDQAGVFVSHGSACSSGSLEPSRILLNMGLSIERARSSIRFSLSRMTTQSEIDQAIKIVVTIVNKMRHI